LLRQKTISNFQPNSGAVLQRISGEYRAKLGGKKYSNNVDEEFLETTMVDAGSVQHR
jgi:hypothetical protein